MHVNGPHRREALERILDLLCTCIDRQVARGERLELQAEEALHWRGVAADLDNLHLRHAAVRVPLHLVLVRVAMASHRSSGTGCPAHQQL